MRIHQITVFREDQRIKITVEMPDPDRYLTSQVPQLPRNLFRLLPTMATHTCHNNHGLSFREECRNTEIPHLFEHLVLELQGRAETVELLRGETEWDWRIDPRGFFTVTVEYENELLVIGAIKLAERMMRALDGKQFEALDMEREIERLRRLASLGREMDAPSFGFSAGNGNAVGDSRASAAKPRNRRTVRRTWENITLHQDSTDATLTSA